MMFGLTSLGRMVFCWAALVASLVFAPLSPGIPVYKQLKSLGNPDGMGTNPGASPIRASDGLFYGTTLFGGSNKSGVIYRVRPDGTDYRVLYHFGPLPPVGANNVSRPVYPVGRLLEADDGRLYGVAANAGASYGGALFRIDKSGENFRTLRTYPITATQPTNPVAGLIQGSDGWLYGTTTEGGATTRATIFRMGLEGNDYQVIHTIGSGAGEPRGTFNPLFEGSDGFLYGTSRSGGATNNGTIFKLKKDGSEFSVIRSFSLPDGDGHSPWGGVIEGSDGFFYGTVEYGGSNTGGGVYRIARDGSDYAMICSFGAIPGGLGFLRRVRGELVEHPDGFLYGVVAEFSIDFPRLPGAVFRVRKDGSGFEVLTGNGSLPGALGSEYPETGLALAEDGSLLGVAGESSPGFLYRLTAEDRSFEILRRFSESGGEPRQPGMPLEGRDGRFYGMGSNNGTYEFFSASRDGGEVDLLLQFRANNAALRPPFEGVDGHFFTASERGGANDMGFVARIEVGGEDISLIHSFAAEPATEPRQPWSGVIQASDGFLYGTTSHGGRNQLGTVFRMAADGSDLTVIHHFTQVSGIFSANTPAQNLLEGSDGALHGLTEFGCYRVNKDGSGFQFTELPRQGVTPPKPRGPLIEGSDGVLYGTASEGGTLGRGIIFKINQDGSDFTVLYQVPVSRGVSYWPIGALAEGTDGKLYGVSFYGGTRDSGTLFSLNRDGTDFSRLHSFGTTGDGIYPEGLVRSGDGLLYGFTRLGGAYNFGTFFRYGEAPEIDVEHPAGIGLTSGASSLDFGDVKVGTDSELEVTIKNSGELPLGPIRVSFQGTHAADYLAEALPADTVASGASSVLKVRFSPAAAGNSEATLLIESDDYDESPFVIALTGFGLAPEIEVAILEFTIPTVLVHNSDDVFSFPSADLGTPVELWLRVANLGNAPLSLGQARLPAGYALAEPHAFPSEIAPGEYVLSGLRLTGQQLGRYSGWIELDNDDADESPFRFQIDGWVIAPEIGVFDGDSVAAPELLAGQAAVVDFGETRLGTSVTRSFTVESEALPSGDVRSLQVEDISVPAGFVVQVPQPLPFGIASGNSEAFQIRLEAATVGTYSGLVTIKNNDPDEAEFTFPITGWVTAPEIAVHDGPDTAAPELASGQTQAVGWGRVIQGTIGGGAARALTIANTGTAPLAVSSITVPPGYELLAETAPTIAPGAAGTWTIRLTSLEPGHHAGSIIITSDDPDEPTFAFPVTGEIYIPDPAAAVADTSTTLNRQTGLREQTVRLTNDTTATVPAYRLLLSGLPAGVTIANATEVRADGTVVVLVRQPLAPFSSFDLVLEYASATRQPVVIDPLIITEVVLDPPDDAAAASPAAGAFAIERVAWLAEAGGLLLEFGSTPGRLYVVEYSDDGATWKTSPTQVRGTGNRTPWIDRGPPRTASPPAPPNTRLYRIRLLAD